MINVESKNVKEVSYSRWLQSILPKHLGVVSLNETICVNTSGQFVPQVLRFLRDHTNCQFKILVDIVGVDYPQKERRFEVIYLLLSTRYSLRLQVKASVEASESVPTVSHLYKSALWFEREVWDMFGISFAGHPDLRRLLTDYGFVGHPLRKDFPLTGFTEVRYDEEKKRVVCEPLELSQDFRMYEVQTPWKRSISRSQVSGDIKTLSYLKRLL